MEYLRIRWLLTPAGSERIVAEMDICHRQRCNVDALLQARYLSEVGLSFLNERLDRFRVSWRAH